MRVIGGIFRGRPLAAPRGQNTRPITDRVKESLFNILAHRCVSPGEIPEVDVLDVFAGTGGLGIEALSRGACHATFIERERQALRCLRDNLHQLALDDRSTVLTDNAWSMRPPSTSAGFGLMFFDPPYRDAKTPLRIIDLLERFAPRLAPDGLVVFRHESGDEIPWDTLRMLDIVDQRRFKRMRVLVLALRAGASPPGNSVQDVPRREQEEEEHRPEDVGDHPDG